MFSWYGVVCQGCTGSTGSVVEESEGVKGRRFETTREVNRSLALVTDLLE